MAGRGSGGGARGGAARIGVGFGRALPGGRARRRASGCRRAWTTSPRPARSRPATPSRRDWAGLTSAGLPVPSGVPGVQVDGYFPDTSTTNTNHGWNHDAQFVIRLPERLERRPRRRRLAGRPRAVRQRPRDQRPGARPGLRVRRHRQGQHRRGVLRRRRRPGDAIAEWNTRVTQLDAARAQAVVRQRYGRLPARTLAAGLSNGGYLVRWQLENVPWLYDGGRRLGGHAVAPRRARTCLTFLPAALAATRPTRRATRTRTRHCSPPGSRRARSSCGPYHYQRLLGPDAADLPRGARPVVRRCAEAGHALLRSGRRLRRRLRLRVAARAVRRGGRDGSR